MRARCAELRNLLRLNSILTIEQGKHIPPMRRREDLISLNRMILKSSMMPSCQDCETNSAIGNINPNCKRTLVFLQQSNSSVDDAPKPHP